MGIAPSTAITLSCDNRTAIQIVHNNVFHDCTKHIEMDYHYVRQHVARGIVRLYSISSADQTVDYRYFHQARLPRHFFDLVFKLNLISDLPP